MKKLITTAIVAAAAFGAFAIETGVWFEAHEIGDASIESLNAAAGITAEGEAYWSAPSTAEDNEYKVKALTGTLSYLPQAAEFGDDEPTKELSIKTTFGQPLSFNVDADKSSESFENDNIYFDSLMKFTVCEEEPETDSYNGAKIVMWLQEKYDAETDEVIGTNIMVKAGYLASEGWTNAVYECQSFTGDISVWHRVTIKTIADITSDGSGVPGFIIYLNGDDNGEVVDGVSTAKTVKSPAAKWETALELTESADYFDKSGAVFPSMTQSGNQKLNLTSVAFDGTGSINMLRFRATAPAFAKDYVKPKATILVGENDVGSGYNLGTFAGIVEAVNAEAAKGTDGAEVAIKVILSAGLELDAPVEIEYNEYASVELDFNGVILTNNVVSCIITNNAMLTVTDSVGTGGIYANVPNQEGGAICQGDNGLLTISNGNFWANIDIGTVASVEIAGGSFQQNEDAFSYVDSETEEVFYLIAQGKWLFADGVGWYTVDDAYTVTFDPNGAEVVIPSQKVRSGSSKADVLANVNPERAGYTLSGWLMEPDAETITADTTFTAQWEAVATPTYTIAVGAPGTGVSVAVVTNGVAAGSAEGDYVVNAGESATVTYTANAGYELTGQATFTFENIAENKVVTAPTATVITYAISYELNGGTQVDNPVSSYTVNSSTVTLPEPTYTGYTFNGWTNETVTTAIKEFTVDASKLGDLKFYAAWTANPPATSEIPAGGTSVDVAGDANAEADVIADQVTLEVTSEVEEALGTGEGAVSKETYQGYFTKKAEYDQAKGMWTVTAEISEEVKADVAESAVEGVLESAADEMYVPRGLYYKITTMDDLGGTPSTPVTGISNGEAIPVIKPGSSKGFIKIQLGTKSFVE